MTGIVVVSYRSDEETIRFVTQELSKVRTEHRTVVVANGASREETEALAGRLPGVTVLPAENGGYAKGNNIGARWLKEHLDPEYILFTNNDIILNGPGVVETLLEAAASHPEAGAVGPEVVGTDGIRQSPEPYMGLWKRYVWMYFCTPFLSRARKRELFRLDYPEKAGEGEHYKLSGSFFLVKADAFFRAGAFDGNTFLYAEENILSERLGRIGRYCLFCPSVRVIHAHGETVNRHFEARKRALLQYDSMAYYYRAYKGYSRLETAIVRLLFQIILLVK